MIVCIFLPTVSVEMTIYLSRDMRRNLGGACSGIISESSFTTAYIHERRRYGEEE